MGIGWLTGGSTTGTALAGPGAGSHTTEAGSRLRSEMLLVSSAAGAGASTSTTAAAVAGSGPTAAAAAFFASFSEARFEADAIRARSFFFARVGCVEGTQARFNVGAFLHELFACEGIPCSHGEALDGLALLAPWQGTETVLVGRGEGPLGRRLLGLGLVV